MEDALMCRTCLLCGLVIGCTIVGSARSASAQRNWPYQPSRPTTSPYLNLYRTDSGVVDNYNAFVRPEIEMRNAMGRQQNALTRQGTNLNTIEQYLSGRQRGDARSTSGAGVFMNYLHYYTRPNTLMTRGTINRGR